MVKSDSLFVSIGFLLMIVVDIMPSIISQDPSSRNHTLYMHVEKIFELDPKKIIPECFEAVGELTDSIAAYTLNIDEASSKNSSNIVEETSYIRSLEYACSNSSKLLRDFTSQTNEQCSHIYSKLFVNQRVQSLIINKDDICNIYGRKIASFTYECDREVKKVKYETCVTKQSSKLLHNPNFRQSFVYVTKQRGNVQTISRDLVGRDRNEMCCTLNQLIVCINNLYEDKCKPLSEEKRSELKKISTARIRKNQKSFECDKVLGACEGASQNKVSTIVFISFVICWFL